MKTDPSNTLERVGPDRAAWHFTFFRILFGGYLAVHFAQLVPYAEELFGQGGLIGNPSLNLTAGLFPNPLNAPLSAAALEGILAGMAGLSLMFAAGLLRPVVALLLWFGWTALFHRNNLISNPSIPYVGLLLVLCALVPQGEPWSFSRRRADWEMPVWGRRTAWVLLAAGYSFSGFTKLGSASWADGSAMSFLLANPLARPGPARELMLHLPPVMLKMLTWGTLALELAFLPLAWWRKSRPWVWAAMAGLHLGILLVLDFADLSWGMLMIHAFTFDPAWLGRSGGFAGVRKYLKRRASLPGPALVLMTLCSCSSVSPHSGRFPFNLAEKPPAHAAGGEMKIVMRQASAEGPFPEALLAEMRPGDVIAFHMSHREALGHLRRGNIQKLPYELFRYGHITLVVPEPGKPWRAGHFRLLQIAMKQAANAREGPDYLKGKSWVVYRPPFGSVDVQKLREFTGRVTVSAADPKKAYDYRGTTGLKNAPWQASVPEEIGHKYSCATLVAAGLHYSGYRLNAVRRGGWFDIITPRQIVESGTARVPLSTK
ncbi:MAG: hypothetical protein V4726_08025 [Verrucomicrobiota bacterium]